jgi:Asp-tRNA(Asn)/Glu-tRNA(Gln) amidotransferase A subunit family amidase
VLPNGFSKEGTPTSMSFIGQLFGEAKLLAVAKTYQEATDFHLKHPKLEE